LTINRLCGVEGWVESNRGRSCKPRGRFAGRQLGLGSTVHRHQDRNWSRRLGRDPHQWGYYRQTHLSNLPPFPTSYLLPPTSLARVPSPPRTTYTVPTMAHLFAFVSFRGRRTSVLYPTPRLCFTAGNEAPCRIDFRSQGPKLPKLPNYYRSKSGL
jgi:hypothetical protein